MHKLKTKTRFNATVYASVRVTIHDIEADTAEQAAVMAETAVFANPNEWFTTKLGKVEVLGCGMHDISDVQFAEEVTAVMIDRLDDGGEIASLLFDRVSDAAVARLGIDALEMMLRQRKDFLEYLRPYLTGEGRAKFEAEASEPTPGVEDLSFIFVGAPVWWTDPDCGKTSGDYVIDTVMLEDGESPNRDTMLRMHNESRGELEALVSEVSAQKPINQLPVIVRYAGRWEHVGYAVDAVMALACGSDHYAPLELLHASSLTDLQPGEHPLAQSWAVTMDPATKVTSLDGKADVWFITQNLTDRWGEVNLHNADAKPLDALLGDSALLTELRSQMWDEATFLVRKDGQFGVLFEVEYASRQSEQGLVEDPTELATYKEHAVVVADLLKGMIEAKAEFPLVEFCVPGPENIINDRPAVWAFVKDGLLTVGQQESLGRKLLRL